MAEGDKWWKFTFAAFRAHSNGFRWDQSDTFIYSCSTPRTTRMELITGSTWVVNTTSMDERKLAILKTESKIVKVFFSRRVDSLLDLSLFFLYWYLINLCLLLAQNLLYLNHQSHLLYNQKIERARRRPKKLTKIN